MHEATIYVAMCIADYSCNTVVEENDPVRRV